MLVFCNIRKSCVQAAEQLRKQYVEVSIGHSGAMPWKLPAIPLQAEDKAMNPLLAYGIAFHHAGLSWRDRQLVEHEFIKGQISIVCATSTLSVGVNLPARVVIIRGVNNWFAGKSTPYSDLDIVQMMGRAGRPKFDTKGVAIVLCEKEKEEHYSDLINSRVSWSVSCEQTIAR